MGEWHPDDPKQRPSAWAEHIDVSKNLEREDRDPRRVLVQQIWVYLEMHKRERAEGERQSADEELHRAKELYDKVTANYPRFPPDLPSRLNKIMAAKPDRFRVQWKRGRGPCSRISVTRD